MRDTDISMTRLLTPNTRVMVRIRRDGRTRELPVVIADAPSRFQLRRDDMTGSMTLTRIPSVLPAAAAFPGSPANLAPRAPRAPAAMRRAVPRLPSPASSLAAPPAPAAIAPGFSPGFTPGGIAGAQMYGVTEGLARTIGVRSGVFVASAPAGSAAGESGLRDGDVIVRVSGQAVRTVPELREIVGGAVDRGERSVELEFVREKRTWKGTLRW